jgi:hypothetical protein
MLDCTRKPYTTWLNQHLQVNNTLVTEQYGFWNDLPTEHAAYSLIDSILHAWNSKIHVAVNFCDLAKAFDCVNHKILILKLQYYGLNDTYIHWLKSYLSNRQRVNLHINNTHNYYSTCEIVNKRVPQELAFFYINDLPMSITHFTYVLWKMIPVFYWTTKIIEILNRK